MVTTGDMPLEGSGQDAFEILRQACSDKSIFLTPVPKELNRPNSPVYNPLDIFVPPIVLLVSSLALLISFGLVEWIVGLILILLYQYFIAPIVVEWRVGQRIVKAALVNAANFDILWRLGGLSLVPRNRPEGVCRSPSGDWRLFVMTRQGDASTARSSGNGKGS